MSPEFFVILLAAGAVVVAVSGFCLWIEYRYRGRQNRRRPINTSTHFHEDRYTQ